MPGLMHQRGNQRWWQQWWRRQKGRYAYRQGLIHLRRGGLAAAIAAFDRALLHHPKPADVWVKRGTVLWQAGDVNGAIASYDRAIASDPRHAPAYGNRGLARYQLGESDAAFDDWAMALSLHHTYADVFYNRALVYLQQQQPEKAIADLDQALAANPNLVEAYYHRGNLRQQQGDRQGAVKDWQLAVCNDLSFDHAKEKLIESHRQHKDQALAAGLQTALALPDVTVETRQRGELLEVHIHRAVGSPMNYLTLPKQIRAYLIRLQLSAIRQFQLIGRVGDQSYPEWTQRYRLYDLTSCPPSHWRIALLALLIFPPFGVAAVFYAAQVKSLYERGDPLDAARASNTVRGLWVLSRSLAAFVFILALGYGVYVRLYLPEPQLGPPGSDQERPDSSADG